MSWTHDEENDSDWDPDISLVQVDSLVTKEGDNESSKGDDDDSCSEW